MVHSDHLAAAPDFESGDGSYKESFRSLILSHLVVGAVILIALAIFTDSQHKTASFATGWAVVLVNLLFFGLLALLFMRKKLVALTGPLIVIKYAILGIFIYKAMALDWVEPTFFLSGVASLMFTALVFILERQRSRRATTRKHGV